MRRSFDKMSMWFFVFAMLVTSSIIHAQNNCPTPGMPSNPTPADGAVNIAVNPTLSWSPSSNTDSYSVYFGTSSNPPYLGNTANSNYPITNLTSNTIYYWRIVATDSCGNFTVGPVWSFKTACLPPTTASNSTPQNGAVVTSTSLSLAWTSSYADSYNVYFGKSPNPAFLGNTLSPSYNVTGLTPNTTYYWSVVALSNCGGSTPGPVWSFTTAPVNPYSSSNWTNVVPPNVSSDWSLNSVHFTSPDEGWAVGADNQNNRGVLLNYLNGTWTSILPPDVGPSWELSSVHFTSANEGWAVGTESISSISLGVLLHYLNGSWTNVTSPDVSPNWALNSIYFTSSSEGWAVGDDDKNQKGVLLHYSNSIWAAINQPDFSYSWRLNSVHFISPNEGWAVGVAYSGGMIIDYLFFHYLDGTWVSPNTFPGGCLTSLNSVYLITPNYGWAVGGWNGCDICGTGSLFEYSNSSWQGSTIGGPCLILNSVFFTSFNEGWAVGEGGSSYLPDLIYQYWYGDWGLVTPSNASSYWQLNSVHFTSSEEGWAVGTDGKNKTGILLRFLAESISTPTTPNGITIGKLGTAYTYSTGGSTSSLGNPVEYQFDWKGDGSDVSDWSSERASRTSQGIQSKTWSVPGVYNIRARARSATNVSVVSAWSNPLTVSISVPKISVIPMAYDFGIVKLKRSKTVSFIVKNSGMANLSILNSTATGTDASMFAITGGSGSKTIKPGKTITIRVAFKPTSNGSKSANLEITSNDPVAPSIDIPLTGTGQ